MSKTIKKWGHDELANDLAEHLAIPNRMIWTDMQMGPSGSRRPDVFTIQKSYTRPNPISYEIKVSVADFRSDVTKGKWQEYLKFSSGVYFCVPKGLVTKADIPASCGLMVRSEKVWRTIKKPTLDTVQMPWIVMQKLLIDGVHQIKENQRPQWAKGYLSLQNMKKELGQDVYDAVRDIESAKNKAKEIESRTEFQKERILDEAKQIRETAIQMAEKKNRQALKMWNELLKILDLSEETSTWQVQNKFRDKIASLKKDSKLLDAKRSIDQAMRHIEHALKSVSIND